ncbi:hypothetical protein HOY80DRAFT_1000398 [Tuber brumale]|nr:hypothetical protein HOY80DRAFT_1000398 [Tuber brumale]
MVKYDKLSPIPEKPAWSGNTLFRSLSSTMYDTHSSEIPPILPFSSSITIIPNDATVGKPSLSNLANKEDEPSHRSTVRNPLGRGFLSNYRQINATSINNRTYNSCDSSITTAPDSGIPKSKIKPALYCSSLDINNAAQLAKFGLHNGDAQNAALLNEKLESLAIVPVDGKIGNDD